MTKEDTAPQEKHERGHGKLEGEEKKLTKREQNKELDSWKILVKRETRITRE